MLYTMRWFGPPDPVLRFDIRQSGCLGMVTLSFTSSGLVAKNGGPLVGYAVAGPDKESVWAQARIEGAKVVWNDQVPKPAVVRYAWADNPEGVSLCNKEGLAASTFTTEPEVPLATGRL
ncbi:MAG TPA: hypothetical protein VF630_09910 [Hymenobacter sp.]